MNIALPITAPHANAATNSTTSNSGVSLNANNAEATFLNMLVTELQNQDPTSPMDPTQMVGQMFSMNQLQQLIDINQTLQTAFGLAPSANSAAAHTSQAVQGAH